MCKYQKSWRVINDGQKKIIIKQKEKQGKILTVKKLLSYRLKRMRENHTRTNNQIYFNKTAEFQNKV